jgi:hypothetical protein
MYNMSPAILESGNLINTEKYFASANNPGDTEVTVSQNIKGKAREHKVAASVEQYLKNAPNTKKIFMRYFGTADPLPICIAGSEAGFGSCKPTKKSSNSGKSSS